MDFCDRISIHAIHHKLRNRLYIYIYIYIILREGDAVYRNFRGGRLHKVKFAIVTHSIWNNKNRIKSKQYKIKQKKIA